MLLFPNIILVLKKILNKNLMIFYTLIFILIVLISGSIYIFFEYDANKSLISNLIDGFWWAIVTITTVGYGDYYPKTLAGRIIAVPVIIFGLGFIGILVGSITSNLFSKRIKAMKGLLNYNLSNHIVICGWNQEKIDILIKEIKNSSILAKKEIILVNNVLEENPFPATEKIYFVKGLQSDLDVLKRASIQNCSHAIVISDTNNPHSDDTTVLTVLLIATINNKIFTCAELLDIKKIDLLKSANCNEIITATDFSTKLLVQSIEDPGLSTVINELITNKQGAQIDSMPVDKSYENKIIEELIFDLYKKDRKLIIAIKSKDEIIVNPVRDLKLNLNDIIYFIHNPV